MKITNKIKKLMKNQEILNSELKLNSKKLQAEFNSVFDKMTKLKKVIKLIENTSNFGFDQGEVISYIHIPELILEFEECTEPLSDYLFDRGLRIDFQHNVLMMGHGATIIVNYAGDVFDYETNGYIMRKNDYTKNGKIDIGLRNSLIRKYMEKTGHYPPVFGLNGDGKLVLLDTTKKD